MVFRQAASRITSSSRIGNRNISFLVNKENKVPELQKQFTANPHLHGADNPTWLKGSNDKRTALIGAGLITFGLIQSCRGLWNMSLGVGKYE